MWGRATFTTVASRTIISWATRTIAMPVAARPAFGGRSVGRPGRVAGGVVMVSEDMGCQSCSGPEDRGTVDPEDSSASPTTIRRQSPVSKTQGEISVRADAQRNYDRI